MRECAEGAVSWLLRVTEASCTFVRVTTSTTRPSEASWQCNETHTHSDTHQVLLVECFIKLAAFGLEHYVFSSMFFEGAHSHSCTHINTHYCCVFSSMFCEGARRHART